MDDTGKFKASRNTMNNYRIYTQEQVDQLTKLVKHDTHDYLNNIEKTIFFESGKGRLYNCDAIKLLKHQKTSSIDLIFADPPYNIKKAEWDTFESQKAYVQWTMKWITEAARVLKPDGSLYICGFSEILADIKWAASDLFEGCKWLIWFYRNKANLGKDWGRSHESILHFRKSKKFKFNLDSVRIPYNEHTLKYPARTQSESSQYSNGKKYNWIPNPLGAKPKDVFEIPTLSNGSWERYNHPTQKPIELVKKFILASSNEDDIILDPFGGSGTTYAVAEAFNRRWIGSELESDYCKTIKNRITDTTHINRIKSETDEIEALERRNKIRGI